MVGNKYHLVMSQPVSVETIGTTGQSEWVVHHCHTTPSEGGRPYASGLPSRGLKQTRNLLYGGERVTACVREAA